MTTNCRETRSEAFFRVTREMNLYLALTFYCWHCKIMTMQKNSISHAPVILKTIIPLEGGSQIYPLFTC